MANPLKKAWKGVQGAGKRVQKEVGKANPFKKIQKAIKGGKKSKKTTKKGKK